MNTSNISVPLKGMNVDGHPMSLDEQSYSYALNAKYEDFDGNGFPIIQNDKSNKLGFRFPDTYKIVGQRYILEQDRLIIFTLNEKTGVSEIGEIHNIHNYIDQTDTVFINGSIVEQVPLEKQVQQPLLTYKKIVENTCLNFKTEYPVQIEYKITDCNLQIYFVDGYNPDRYLYFYYDGDYIKIENEFKIIGGYTDKTCKTPIYTDQLDCEKLKILPNIDRPCISVTGVTTGGKLKAGSYQFFFSYATATGDALSSYNSITNIVPIKSKNISFEIDYETNLAISLNISGQSLDSIYRYYNLVVAETINSFTEYKLIGTYSVTQTKYTYTGNENLVKLSENDVFQKYPYYKNSKTLAKSNNYLFRTGLEEFNKPNLQRIANKIKLKWQTVKVKEDFYKDPKATTLFRSYLRDEVYAFGIVFEYDNGEDSPVYHIPGRESTPYDMDTIKNEDVVEYDGLNFRNKRWQVYNTGSITASPHYYSDDINKINIWEEGDFSYWESSETYPNNPDIWGSLCGKKIRHHKFPDSSVTHIHDGKDTNKDFNATNYIFPLGVKVDHAQIKQALLDSMSEGLILPEDYNRIKSYRIVRGNRTGNKTIVAKGLLYDMFSYSKLNNKYYYPNYPYNDLRDDPFISSKDFYDGLRTLTPNKFENTGRYTFHSPDTHFVEPTLGSILKLETEEYGKSEGFFNECKGQAEHRIVSSNVFDMSLKFATGLANDLDIGTQTDSAASGLGSALGAGAGMAVAGPLGGAIGSAFGKALGGLLADSTGGDNQDLAESLTKLSFAMYNYEKFVEIFKAMLPYHNYHVQYNSIGKYINYRPVLIGNKQRLITNSAYLKPEITSVSEDNSSTLINNWSRESSVYLKVNTKLAATTKVDTSRNTLSYFNCQLDFKFKSDISSFYASIKNNLLAPYGNIYNVNYIEIGNCNFKLKDTINSINIFGGDTFINKFSLKRKLSHFATNTYKLANDTDFYYSLMGNVGFPIYYFNTKSVTDFYLGNPFSIFNVQSISSGFLGLGSTVVVPPVVNLLSKGSLPQTNLMCQDTKFASLKSFTNKGYIPLYNYGIPIFFVESDINVDYRHGENTKEKDFYPNQTDLNYWLQENNVSPLEDNYYFYNKDYSKQVRESYLGTNDVNFKPNEECKVVYPNRIVYSEQASNIDDNNARDNWLIYKALNKHDFSLANGKLISAEGIENDRVLVRFENTWQVFNAFVTIPTNADTIQIGTGGMFQSKPQEFSHTDLGYGGTQHRAIVHTEFGHVWVDSLRGQVLNLLPTGQFDELSAKGMKNWFKENLPFKIKKYFPNINIDCWSKNLGISIVFDKRFNRIIITKKDYVLLDDGVTYDGNVFYRNGKHINFTDTQYFADASWTISYNFITQSWVSYHSYKHSNYIGLLNTFVGVDNNDLWIHGITNKSYQVYNGTLYPFIVETISKPDPSQKVMKSFKFNAEVFRYHNNYDYYYNNTTLPFNKAIVYNNQSNSGLLSFEKVNKNDLSTFGDYPVKLIDKNIIQITNKENNWSFNQFYNLLLGKNNIPMFLNDYSNTNKTINPLAFNYLQDEFSRNRLRGEWFKVRLIQDIKSNYKIIYKWILNNNTNSVS